MKDGLRKRIRGNPGFSYACAPENGGASCPAASVLKVQGCAVRQPAGPAHAEAKNEVLPIDERTMNGSARQAEA